MLFPDKGPAVELSPRAERKERVSPAKPTEGITHTAAITRAGQIDDPRSAM